jgi:hypothetical protein
MYISLEIARHALRRLAKPLDSDEEPQRNGREAPESDTERCLEAFYSALLTR